MAMPAALCSAAVVTEAATGHVALMAAEQVAAAQLKPVATGSRSEADVAVYGPILLTVTV